MYYVTIWVAVVDAKGDHWHGEAVFRFTDEEASHLDNCHKLIARELKRQLGTRFLGAHEVKEGYWESTRVPIVNGVADCGNEASCRRGKIERFVWDNRSEQERKAHHG